MPPLPPDPPVIETADPPVSAPETFVSESVCVRRSQILSPLATESVDAATVRVLPILDRLPLPSISGVLTCPDATSTDVFVFARTAKNFFGGGGAALTEFR